MEKKKRQIAEFRYYKMPEGCGLFALLGKKWRQQYGRDIDCLHFHNYLEIGYCYDGKGVMTLGKQEYDYYGNEFTVIPKNYLHTTNSIQNTLSSWEYLFVDVDKLLKKTAAGTPGRAEHISRRINSRALFLKSSDRPRMAELIRSVMNVMRDRKPFCQEEAEGLMAAFLAEVARMNPAEEGQPDSGRAEENGSGKIDNLIFHVLDYISETHFRRLFSSYMKMGPLEYLNQVRIQAACEYLKKTDEPVAMIAAKCGFPVSSTFNRNFRRLTGVSPAEWRNRPENYEQQLLKFKIRSEKGW